MAIKEFTIDRSKWLCARNNKIFGIGSQLLDDSDSKSERMCCMGFYSKACGVPKVQLKGKGVIDDLDEKYRAKVHPKLLVDNPAGERLDYEFYGLNDSESYNPKKLEERLTAKFKNKLGVKVKFVGKYPSRDESEVE